MKLRALSCITSMIIVSGSMAWAAAPDQSVRPSLRGELVAKTAEINLSSLSAPLVSLRPKQRNIVRTTQPSRTAKRAKRPGLFSRLKSKKPSKRLNNPFSKKVKRGAVCGVPGIEGAHISAVPGRIRGCGVAEPVRVTAVDGVHLSQPAIMDCPTAKALHSWVNSVVKPAVGRKGGGVKSLKIAAHYACRTRNNKKGAKISEHGRGRAVDISAIQLSDGSSLTVLKDWNSRNRKIMRAIHKGACGPFGTVLGPKSDRYHQDHFHFDTARYRSGPYCR